MAKKEKTMPSGKATENDNDYTPEELLTAAAIEYRKLESENQNGIERMYAALSSPFKLAEKMCEIPRIGVLSCFEQIMGEKTGGSSHDKSGIASLSPTSEFPPVHRCYDLALQYEACVSDKSLAQHHDLLAAFESRRLRMAESAGTTAVASDL